MAETNHPARWVKAIRMAESIADHGMDGPLRTYLVLYLPVGTLLLAGLGFTGSRLLFGNSWHLDVEFGLLVAAFGTMIGALVYPSRRIKPMLSMARSSPLTWLEVPEQKNLRQQILGKTPLVPEHLTVARGVAVEARYTLARQIAFAPAYCYLCIAQLLNARQDSRGLSLYIWVALLLLSAWMLAYAASHYRKIGAFLDDTRDTAEPA